ncbi:unnamed protein product [Symbiodinium natans]|uniref:Rhamnosyl O-methyltransferase n=1 Tax=Symbiodinium natans TaxID=878477 RepID=A0A812PV28_9DINO|nr:unnamed protein product [Symbiodinium natans]
MWESSRVARLSLVASMCVGVCAEFNIELDIPPPLPAEHSIYVDKDQVVDLGNGKKLTVDDIVIGMEYLFERRVLYDKQRWRGMIMEQNPLDAFAIQHFLYKAKPDVLIEFGTNTGGAAVFYAEMMTAYNPASHVITIDPFDRVSRSHTGYVPEVLASSSPLWGTAVRPIVGDPTWRNVSALVRKLLRDFNASSVFIIEDGRHRRHSVLSNLLMYHDLVKPCGWILVQDTRLDRTLHRAGEGPYAAVKEFLTLAPYYRIRRDFEYYLFTNNPMGWLQKVPPNHDCSNER